MVDMREIFIRAFHPKFLEDCPVCGEPAGKWTACLCRSCFKALLRHEQQGLVGQMYFVLGYIEDRDKMAALVGWHLLRVIAAHMVAEVKEREKEE